jgi:hypothetical protein
MADHARQHAMDSEAVPQAIRHEEKTAEVPAAVPERVIEQDTVPVRSSLEKMVRQEMLRKRSARDDGSGER